MRSEPSFAPHGALAPRVELVLSTPEGGEWAVSLSPGMERFIGLYPRLDGICSEGPLLHFRAA